MNDVIYYKTINRLEHLVEDGFGDTVAAPALN